MSIPQVDPQVEQDVADAAGVILKTTLARNIVAGTLAIIGGTIVSATSALGTLALTVGISHIPSWMPVSLIVAYAAFTPLSTIGHGIWKANVK